MKYMNYVLMMIVGLSFMVQSGAQSQTPKHAAQPSAKEEVKEKCITLKSTGEKQCFTVRRTLISKPSEAKDAVEVNCISQKTGEKKSVWMYKGLGVGLLSDKEVCMKQFGEDFTNVER